MQENLLTKYALILSVTSIMCFTAYQISMKAIEVYSFTTTQKTMFSITGNCRTFIINNLKTGINCGGK